MIVASLIDADEKTIPDLVTIPGTLIGLALITALPAACRRRRWALRGAGRALWIEPLTLASPNDWPHALSRSNINSLAIALGCYSLVLCSSAGRLADAARTGPRLGNLH